MLSATLNTNFGTPCIMLIFDRTVTLPAYGDVSFNGDAESQVGGARLGDHADRVGDRADVGKDVPVVEAQVGPRIGVDGRQPEHQDAEKIHVTSCCT